MTGCRSSSDPVRVRRATLDDASSLAALGADAFVAAFGAANPPGVVDAYVADAFSVETLARQIGDPAARWFVAEGEGGAVGMAHLVGGDAPPEVPGRRPVQLVRLYTAAGLTSRGVGSLLLETAIESAIEQGHDAMWLGVWEHNPRAVDFYRRWGFEQIGTVAFRLGDDDQTDLIMSRPLSTDP